jgi:uncharacterized lipoprotein YajG
MKSLIFLPLLLILTGCAFTREHVTISYNPIPETCCEWVNNIQVSVHVIDDRVDKSIVGCKKNGCGMETAYLLANNDISEVLENALKIELQQRGFVISEGGNSIHLEIYKFRNNYEIGIFSADAKSELLIHLSVNDQYDNISILKQLLDRV